MLSSGRVDQPPTPSGQFLVDAVTAAAASEATIAALLHRERTKEGQLVTINMLDVITTLQMQELSIFTVGKVAQMRSKQPHAHSYIRAPYGVFATKKDFIAVAFPSLKQFGELIGEPSFETYDDENDSWTHRDEIFAKTQERLLGKTAKEWLVLFREHGIWAGEVYGYEELVNDPQIAHNKTFIEYEHPTEGHIKAPGFPYKFSKSPAGVSKGAPLIGEDTRDILANLGYSQEKIELLIKSGNVAGK
jgi:crotonobetainyl-CoA:carnitine CoA-transferase CaiB-like acyl-CoA transferase